MVEKVFDFSKIKEAGVIRSQVMHVYKIGKMNVINVIGLPGTGKSWACLRLAELICEDINGKNKITIDNVVTDLLGLLKFIRRVKGPGEVVVCEEIGVWLSSRRAMASENVDAGAIFDTLRKKRIIVITNNPISSHVDKRLVSLSSMLVETKGMNKKLGICKLKPMRLQTNPSTGKTYMHRLKTPEGYDVNISWSGKPDKQLTDDYENSKDDYLNALYEKLQNKHQAKQDKELGGSKIPETFPTQGEKERYEMFQGGLTLKQIAELKGVSSRAIGYSIERYKGKIKKIQNLNSANLPKRPATNLITK